MRTERPAVRLAFAFAPAAVAGTKAEVFPRGRPRHAATGGLTPEPGRDAERDPESVRLATMSGFDPRPVPAAEPRSA
jgi:hypothetical protein